MRTTFTDEHRAHLQGMGFTFGFGRVCEMAYKETDIPRKYVVVNPDDNLRIVYTSRIEHCLDFW